MKKVALIVALSISMLANSAPMDPPGKVVGVKIEFGKRSLDCKKFSICRIIIEFDIASLFSKNQLALEDRVAYGYASTTESSRFTIKFIKQYMTSETQSEFFKDGKFLVDEEFILPNDVAKELNLPQGYTVRKGLYPYTENDKEIILNL